MNVVLSLQEIGSVDVNFTDRGQGHPVLLLHGGAGPGSVLTWADRFAQTHPVRVITPVHPGFGGTLRPEGLVRMRQLGQVYAALVEKLGLGGVTVVGNSIGGWIAAELALAAGPRVGSLVLVDATGIEIPGHPVADVFSLKPDAIGRLSYHNPERYRIDPSKLTSEQRAQMTSNMAVLRLYGGRDGVDPTLRERLSTSALPPTLVVWGESDGIVDREYGRAYAQAIAGAEFRVLPGAGHLPQLETPELLMGTVWPFAARVARLTNP